MGVAAALATAIFAATTNLLVRRAVVQIGGAAAQTWRATVSSLLFLVAFLALRDPRTLLDLPPGATLILLSSVVLNMVLGDLLLYAAMTRLGIALAMPIASSYPLVTLIIATATLGELPTVRATIGTLLVIAGVIFVALPRRARDADGARRRVAPAVGHWAGVALALGSAACIAGATVLTRVALREIDVVTANMLRLPFGAVVCALISTIQRREPPWRIGRQSRWPLLLAGVTGLGSSVCFLLAITLVGASVTATLNAAAPIFGLLGAVVFFGERPTARNVAGALVAVVGVGLVI